ncbi:MAG: hypothetical protein HYZ26_14020 [Chloroflexi bacterium]|nr:hypothetical protein [Chloroflexota bacterium]
MATPARSAAKAGNNIMMSREHPMVGVWMKIGRAEKHISDFEKTSKSFLETKPFSFRHEEDHQAHLKYLVVDNIRPIPDELVPTIGDAIHNLRTSLDLLACQLMRRQNISHSCEHVSFPIFDNVIKFSTALQEPKVQAFGSDAVQIISRLQPYQGGTGNALWELHRLDIQDKHRFLIVAVAAIDSVEGRIVVNPESSLNRKESTFSSAPNQFKILKIGHRFARIDLRAVVPNQGEVADIKLTFTGDIVLDEPGIVDIEPVLKKLKGYADVVKQAVSQFFPLFS